MKKSSKVIDLVINIIWWVSIIFTVLLGLDVVISLASINRSIEDIPQQVWRGEVISIFLSSPALTPAAKISQSFIEFVTMLFSLLVIYNLRKILLDRKSKFTVDAIIKRIQLIGIIVIAGNIIISIIKYYFANQIFLSADMNSGMNVKVEFNFSMELFFLGFVILGLAEVIKRWHENHIGSKSDQQDG
ncbi:MAG: hypothetical protein APR63_02435 [Desulfuromonas sp. SDB]|nr:MAG: hypothetical protein APR63_02435 [Desulfuromonas sp. SDB]